MPRRVVMVSGWIHDDRDDVVAVVNLQNVWAGYGGAPLLEQVNVLH